MDTWAVVFSYLAIGLALATASVTLTRARIFEPVRTWSQKKSFLLFKLISCPYCMCHWLALWLVPFTMYVITDIWLFDAALTWFMLVGIGALFEGLLMKGLLMQENYIQDLEERVDELRELQTPPAPHPDVVELSYLRGVEEGQRQERERFAAMDVKLRAPIAPA